MARYIIERSTKSVYGSGLKISDSYKRFLAHCISILLLSTNHWMNQNFLLIICKIASSSELCWTIRFPFLLLRVQKKAPSSIAHHHTLSVQITFSYSLRSSISFSILILNLNLQRESFRLSRLIAFLCIEPSLARQNIWVYLQ